MANEFINIYVNELEKILKQDRFKHVNHDLKNDIDRISTIFPIFGNQNNDNLYSFADGLIRVPYDQIYISGGYFFKYSLNNPYAMIFLDEYKKFKRSQKIDLYFNDENSNFENLENVKAIFKPRFTTKTGTVMSLELNHNGAEITINYLKCNDGKTIMKGTSAIYEFDAELCKVAYNIKNRIFSISPWFKSENDDLFSKDVDFIRNLKFKMKGFYNNQDEVAIWAAFKKTSLDQTKFYPNVDEFENEEL